MKDTIKTNWLPVFPVLKDFTPTQPKPEPKPQAKLKYKRIHRAKPPSPLPVVSVDEIPEKLVQEIDYSAFIARLKQGPMVVGQMDVAQLSRNCLKRGMRLGRKTFRAVVNGVRTMVVELRIKE